MNNNIKNQLICNSCIEMYNKYNGVIGLPYCKECEALKQQSISNTGKQYILSKYPHLLQSGINPIIDFELEELGKWFDEYAQLRVEESIPIIAEHIAQGKEIYEARGYVHADRDSILTLQHSQELKQKLGIT